MAPNETPSDRPPSGRSLSDRALLEGVRLQRVLARAGVASRRAAEGLITAGRVEVDGTIVDTLGTRIDPARSIVKVDGQRVVTDETKVYLALNKPRGVVTTMRDPRGRATVGDLVSGRAPGLFHVGRLDAETEGLLLITNDGDLGHRIAHPSFDLRKTYVAHVAGRMSRSSVRQLRTGVVLDDGPARADSVRVLQMSATETLVEIAVHEGRNRIVRRMFDAVGNPVQGLVRTEVGPVRLAGLNSGHARSLSAQEISALFRLSDKTPKGLTD